MASSWGSFRASRAWMRSWNGMDALVPERSSRLYPASCSFDDKRSERAKDKARSFGVRGRARQVEHTTCAPDLVEPHLKQIAIAIYSVSFPSLVVNGVHHLFPARRSASATRAAS